MHSHPPCNVDMKHMTSLSLRTVFSASNNYQSTSFTNTRMPGLTLLPVQNMSFLSLAYWPLRMLTSSEMVVFSGVSNWMTFCPPNTRSSPPLRKAVRTWVQLAISYEYQILSSVAMTHANPSFLRGCLPSYIQTLACLEKGESAFGFLRACWYISCIILTYRS